MIKNVNSKQFVHACTNVLAIPMPDAACYYAPDISCTKVLVVAIFISRLVFLCHNTGGDQSCSHFNLQILI